MTTSRIFNSTAFFQPADGEPIRSVITESNHAVVVAWYIKPATERAVRQFQQATGRLAVDGIVGPTTLRELRLLG